MEIRKYYCYIFVNCVILPFLSCKSISLNDIIAAEKQAALMHTAESKISETKTKVKEYSNNHSALPTIFTKHTTGSIIPINKKISPLKYKKTFQIRAPLRPKKIKYSYKPRSRRINTTNKREITDDEKLNRNYIPLLKSLSVLFNNILGSDSGEDDDEQQYYKRHRSIARSEECTCTKSKHSVRESEPTEKATATSASVTAKISSEIKTISSTETSSASTYNTVNDNKRSLRRDKNLSVLPTRNTTSSWRNHNGFSEGSLSAHYRNIERNISRNNGHDENNNSGGRKAGSYTENYNRYPKSGSRYDASCNGSYGTIGRNRNYTENAEDEATTTEAETIWSNETFSSDRGDSNKFKGFDQLEAGRNKTESGEFLLQSNSGLRRYSTEKETTESLRQIQSSEENTFNITNNSASNQRIYNGDDTMAAEDQEYRRPNETLILDDISLSTTLVNKQQSDLAHDKQKIVMIYDGYSIARDVNGNNKLTEKAYRIHS